MRRDAGPARWIVEEGVLLILNLLKAGICVEVVDNLAAGGIGVP